MNYLKGMKKWNRGYKCRLYSIINASLLKKKNEKITHLGNWGRVKKNQKRNRKRKLLKINQ